MMRSMYSSVSGLSTHQARMDTIGNNIANVNTIGYKSSSADFVEIFSQTMEGASSPRGGRGGTNPKQVGLGISMGGINVKHTQGAMQTTNNPTDLTIQGDGFFIVTDDPTFNNKYYTRAGNFQLDAKGNLVTQNGMKVLGVDGKPVVIDKSETTVGTKTTDVKIYQNLNVDEKFDEDTKTAFVTSTRVYDSLGSTHDLKFEFGERLNYSLAGAPPATGTLRNVKMTLGGVSAGNLDMVDKAAGTLITDAIYAKFDSKGKFQGLVSAGTFDVPTQMVTTVTNLTANATTLEVKYTPPGADEIKINMWPETGRTIFDKMTHFSMGTDLVAKEEDGNAAGKINEFNISKTGDVVVTFTNGEKKTISTVGMATFDNNGGLMKSGFNLFVDTTNSGRPKISAPGSGAAGLVQAGVVEMSNVDLSLEFTNMITTQRGFQANARVITTSDEILQELTNLKR